MTSDIQLSAATLTDVGFNQHLGNGDKAWFVSLNATLALVRTAPDIYSASVHMGNEVVAQQEVSTLTDLEHFINQTLHDFLWTSM